jgi:hypothetical protein
MTAYRRDRAWSDAFIPAIKKIVGPYLLEPSSFEIDAQQATDLIVLLARDLRIAARVRLPDERPAPAQSHDRAPDRSSAGGRPSSAR